LMASVRRHEVESRRSPRACYARIGLLGSVGDLDGAGAASVDAMTKGLIFAHSGEAIQRMADLGDGAELVEISDLSEVAAQDRPAVLILCDALCATGPVKSVPGHICVLADGQAARSAADDAGRLFLGLDDLSSEGGRARALRSAMRASANDLARVRVDAQLSQVHGDLRGLNKVGMALMSERDPDALLGMILTQARRLTNSDAGSLYLVEETEDGEEVLHFLRAQNASLPDLPTPDFSLPFDESSVAGFTALHGEPLVIDDAYEIPESAPYSFNRTFDEEVGYRAKSMLVVPMKDHRDAVVGVLQLINRKSDPLGVIRDEASADEHVLSYETREVELVQSLAGQAAVSIENGQLYRDIENLFEGFIKAAVIAIDQRDPTTSGHSVRVATLTCDIAEVADKAADGPFKDVGFTREQMKELRYAGLLHDFGKVGVRENVLVKSKKLPPVLIERIESRFDLIRRTLESEFHQQKAEQLLKNGKDGFDVFQRSLEETFETSLQQLDRFQEAIRESNEPRVLPEASADILHDIAATTFTDFEGQQSSYITDDELHFLAIPKGSLDPDERLQIESHVTHTYNFLTQIPWTEDLSRVADIAHGHHEKLNGTGYPRGIGAQEIAIQTRIMTVADIFDALTASDRPYKKALPATRALDILGMEAKDGMLDHAVVELLLASEVYHKILESDWREF
jgi:HD-GYP domain-containing protein (c-di-GMP phosphodiesterase class II)